MQTQKSEVWNRGIKEELSISLPELKYSNVTVLLWRGVIIKTKIGYRTGHFGWPSLAILDVSVSDTIHQFKANASNSICKQVHRISNGTHFLYFLLSGQQLVLKQEAVHKKFEDAETTSSAFEIILCQDYESNLMTPYKVVEDPLKVTLNEDSNSNRAVGSQARFINEDLEVDYWEMGRSSCYEDEHYITVKKYVLYRLYNTFDIKYESKIELLQAILKSFSGEGCFKEYRAFLETKGIPFESGVRHD